ncbi:MAG: hypothetical protein AB4368_32755 [Xenococcaceae cyanobacterium]
MDTSATQTIPAILSLKTNDAAEMSEFQRGWDQDYVQLQRGKFSWKIDIIQIDELQIFEEVLGGKTLAKGLVPKGD